MTYPEQMLWRRLRKLDAHIRRQAPLGRYIVDFVCHRARLVIEVDGGIHQRGDVALRDLERDDWLRSQGYRVLRVSNHAVVERLDETFELIQAALGETPPSPDHEPVALPPHPPTPSPSRGRGEEAPPPPSPALPPSTGKGEKRYDVR